MQRRMLGKELFVGIAFGRVHVGDVSAEGRVFCDGACVDAALEQGILQKSAGEGIGDIDFGVDFAAVRTKVCS